MSTSHAAGARRRWDATPPEQRREHTARARQAARNTWAAQVDPDGTLTDDELTELYRAHMRHLGRLSGAARRDRSGGAR